MQAVHAGDVERGRGAASSRGRRRCRRGRRARRRSARPGACRRRARSCAARCPRSKAASRRLRSGGARRCARPAASCPRARPSIRPRKRVDRLEGDEVEIAPAPGQQASRGTRRAAAARAGSRARGSGRAGCGEAPPRAPLRGSTSSIASGGPTYAYCIIMSPARPIVIAIEADEAQLPVGQLGDLAKGIAPDRRRAERADPFEDETRARGPSTTNPRADLRARCCAISPGHAAACVRARLVEVLEELAGRLEDHQVVASAERRLVRLEAAIERIELGFWPYADA
jgi:hypothetical protein